MALKGRISLDITMIAVNLQDAFAKYLTVHFADYFKW